MPLRNLIGTFKQRDIEYEHNQVLTEQIKITFRKYYYEFCKDENETDITKSSKVDQNDDLNGLDYRPGAIETDVYMVESLADEQLNECLNILDINLGEVYKSLNGSNWKDQKLIEMKEKELNYILLYKREKAKKEEKEGEANDNSKKIVGFMSMRILQETVQVIYLYEIQITPEYRGKGLGTHLLDNFHSLVTDLNKNEKFKSIFSRYKEANVRGTQLTVFSSNTGADKLYRSLGYLPTGDSPRDRKLRSGAVLKPDYYLLERMSHKSSRRKR